MCVKWGDCQIVAWSFLSANNTSKHRFFSCFSHCPQISALDFTFTPFLPRFVSNNLSVFSESSRLWFFYLLFVCATVFGIISAAAGKHRLNCVLQSYTFPLFTSVALLFLSSDPIASCIPFRGVFAIFPPAPLSCVIWRDEKELSGRGDHGLPV